MTTATVLGLGAMGLPMATWLSKTMAVRGYDVSAERLAMAVDAGVTGCTTAAEACQGADVVVIGVRDGHQLEEALYTPVTGAVAGMSAGAVVILTSTVGADVAAAAGTKLAEHGVDLVDAPVSGGAIRAGKGDLLIMVSGTDQALAKADSVLHSLGSTVVVAGNKVGDGQNMKTVNQLLAGVHTAAANEALALANALGLPLEPLIEVLGQGAAASFMLADRGPRIAQQLHGEQPPLRSRLDVINKDMGIVTQLARSVGVATPVAAAAGQLYEMAMAQGLAASDDSVVATILGEKN